MPVRGHHSDRTGPANLQLLRVAGNRPMAPRSP